MGKAGLWFHIIIFIETETPENRLKQYFIINWEIYTWKLNLKREFKKCTQKLKLNLVSFLTWLYFTQNKTFWINLLLARSKTTLDQLTFIVWTKCHRWRNSYRFFISHIFLIANWYLKYILKFEVQLCEISILKLI